MSFQIHALPRDQFESLFAMSESELVNVLATRIVVKAHPGYPCRVSLEDAEIGETVILVNYVHQNAESPFRASHAIYVRENAKQSFPEVGTIPAMLDTRLISARAFDDRHYIVNADVVDGAWATATFAAPIPVTANTTYEIQLTAPREGRGIAIRWSASDSDVDTGISGYSSIFLPLGRDFTFKVWLDK